MSMGNGIPRRNWLVGAGASLAAAALPMVTFGTSPQTQSDSASDSDRVRRMQWWHEAKFGMFIHWGLYSVVGRHEWVMENEGIPVAEYKQLAKKFKPNPFPAREWAKLARLPARNIWS